MQFGRKQRAWAGTLFIALAATVQAYDGMVEKKPFTIPAYFPVLGMRDFV